MLLFVGLKNDLWALFIRKRHLGWDKSLIKINSLYRFGIFIPQENSSFLNSLALFSKIMFKLFLPFPLIKDTFYRFLLHFSHIDPSAKILGMWSLSKARILQQLLMLIFNSNWIKRTFLLYSSFLTINQLLRLILKRSTGF